ncbi:MAG: aromatic ring-hydroxylating dioxygenase subunit alpha [Gammaproteobacteria bacterium]|nr:aromatic ring-hydroxylating dioxygenase subunit alpha [Gammaproteobacteria bacterium]
MGYDLTKPSDPALAPGEARCPGPSTRDIIASDGDQVPPPLLEESYQFLGDADIAFNRYTSEDLYDREIRRVWSRTWQWACREEHIPNVGDYVVYDVGPYSIIVIRVAQHEIKGYVNSCLHRGMQLCDAGSQGQGKQFLRCPFHGFTWHLDGTLKEVPCRWDFPHLNEDEFNLPEVRVGLWGGFVFINMDPDAQDLMDYLEVLPNHFAHWPLQERFVAMHVEKVLPANWKMAIEAFLEAYHVLATHSEAVKTVGDANAQYDIFGENVTRFVHTIGYPSPHLRDQPSQEEQLQALGGGHLLEGSDKLPPGETARSLFAAFQRREFSKELGVDLSGVSTSEMLDSIEYFVFPNMFLFPGITIPMIYRFRPIDVDHCIHEILFLHPVPENGPRPPPAQKVRLEIEDSYSTVEGFNPGLAYVFDQDTDNLYRQRAGAKASVKGAQTLGNYQEARIRRLHMTLDNYLNT